MLFHVSLSLACSVQTEWIFFAVRSGWSMWMSIMEVGNVIEMLISPWPNWHRTSLVDKNGVSLLLTSQSSTAAPPEIGKSSRPRCKLLWMAIEGSHEDFAGNRGEEKRACSAPAHTGWSSLFIEVLRLLSWCISVTHLHPCSAHPRAPARLPWQMNLHDFTKNHLRS